MKCLQQTREGGASSHTAGLSSPPQEVSRPPDLAGHGRSCPLGTAHLCSCWLHLSLSTSYHQQNLSVGDKVLPQARQEEAGDRGGEAMVQQAKMSLSHGSSSASHGTPCQYTWGEQSKYWSPYPPAKETEPVQASQGTECREQTSNGD